MVIKCISCDVKFSKYHPRSFHRFPAEPGRTQWSSFLGLEGVDTMNKFVCSDHFTEDDFITKPSGIRYLKSGALPIVYRKPPVRTFPIIHFVDPRVGQSQSSVPSTSSFSTSGPIIHSDNGLETNCETVEKFISDSKHDVSTQTFTWKEFESLKEENMELKTELKNLRQKLKMCRCSDNPESKISLFVKDLEGNDKRCVFYTGLIFQQIVMLLTFLSPLDDLKYWATNYRADSRRRKFTHLEELILTLVRLRSGLLVEDLRYRFDISAGSITKIVTTWVQHMYIKFDTLRPMMFCSREKIKENLPAIFSGLKNIRVIIDCAEFTCQSPMNFEEKSNCYSSYKAATTFKVLLGCSPNGAITFVSDLFEGSISDKELVKKSNLLDMLEEGDLVLADRGFTINEMAANKKIHLNIPPFLKGRDKLTAQEEIETKNIAKNRIYIEHVVSKVKQFRLLKKCISNNMKGILSQIVFVCCCLVNFQKPILKPNDN